MATKVDIAYDIIPFENMAPIAIPSKILWKKSPTKFKYPSDFFPLKSESKLVSEVGCTPPSDYEDGNTLLPLIFFSLS